MADEQAALRDRAMREAAVWRARLNSRSVSTADLEDFYGWRRDALNAAAYTQTEALWRTRSASDVENEVAGGLGDMPGSRVVPRGWWQDWRFQASLAGALLVMVLGVWSATRPLVFETGIGEQGLVRLADGSRIRLDTHSRVEIRLRSTERDVVLAGGQAFFEVAKDPARPFLVAAQGTTIRALGTRFGVRAEDGAVAVVLAEGSVRVSGAAAGTAVLHPGETITLVRGKAGAPGPADVEALTSWTSGKLIFHNTPLVAAIAEMNRYSNRPIVLDTSRAGALRVSGVFDTDSSDAFVTAAAAVSGLHVRLASDNSTHLAE